MGVKDCESHHGSASWPSQDAIACEGERGRKAEAAVSASFRFGSLIGQSPPRTTPLLHE